jgi:hypothetical protein
MYVAPADASITMGFNQAMKYASELKVGDKQDFRLPSIQELEVIYDNCEKGSLRGTFHLRARVSRDTKDLGWVTDPGDDSASYWSSEPGDNNFKSDYAWSSNFGIRGFPGEGTDDTISKISVRCIR